MFRRIVVAIDDSGAAEVALSFTTALAVQNGAEVRVVHVNEYLVGGRGVAVETRTEAIHRLETAVDQLREAGVTTEGSLYLTHCMAVEDRIVNAAHQWQADVIVLGSRRRRRFRWAAGPGMRERVLRLTVLPVLAAPAPLEVAADKPVHVGQLPESELADYPAITI